MQTLSVDLSRPPRERWQLTDAQQRDARGLIETYKADLGLGHVLPASEVTPLIVQAGALLVPTELQGELEGLAQQIAVPYGDVLICNLYYDAIKAVLMGCTAFAVDRSDGPLHARNLDWWSDARLLSRATLVTAFHGAPAGEFITVGWPGFIGAMSGVAPGRFAVTLNSVLSFDAFELATPVVFLLRDVLATARDFDEALSRLADTPVASDSLLLLTGARQGELAVIERTPTRSAVRRAEGGILSVTNDYRALPDGAEQSSSLIAQTSCSRFDRIRDLLREPATDYDTCLRYLEDPGVRMDMTMQHMVFHARSGEYRVKLPA
ncbi:MAG: C45 family peptidase [Polyangiaceae bacterium]